MTARAPLVLLLAALALAAALLWASRPGRPPVVRVPPGAATAHEREVQTPAPSEGAGRAAAGAALEPVPEEVALERWRISGDLVDARTGDPMGIPVTVQLFGAVGQCSGMTDDSGRRYVVMAEAPGRYELRARAEDHATFVQTVTLRGDSDSRRIDIALSPARRVLVRARTPDGQDLEIALQRAGLGQAGELVATITDARPGTRLHARPPRDGDFLASRFDGTQSGMRRAFSTIPPDAMGVLELDGRDASPVALVFGETVVASQALPCEATELAFVVGLDALGSLLASVDLVLSRASDGAPVDASVSVSPFPFLFRTRRTEGGSARFQRLQPGRQWLVVEAEGLERRVLPLDLEPGERRHVPLELARGCRLGGVVQDGAGNGVLADVTVLRLDATPPVVVARRWTEPDGSFSIDGLGRTPHAVVLAGDESSATNSRVLDWVAPSQRVNPPDYLRLRATRGAILWIAREDSDPRPLEFELRDDQGLPVRRDEVPAWDGIRLCVPAGGYTVQVSRAGVESARFGVQVGGDPVRLVVSQ